MSSKPAAIPLFADAYLADTMHLSTEEHGAYLLLLMAAWRFDDCSLPSDDKKLAKVARLSTHRWAKIRDTIREFWVVEGDRIYNPRLRRERDFVQKKSAENRKNANARWEKQRVENKQSDLCERICDPDAPPPPPIEDTNVSSPPYNPPTDEKPKSDNPKPVKFAMPVDWQPSDFSGDVGEMVAGWPEGRLASEVAEFREYWIEKREKRPGWDRTFRARVRTVHERVMRDQRNAGTGQNNRGGASGYRGRGDRGDGLERALFDVIAACSGEGGGDPVEPAGQAGRWDAGDGAEDRALPAPGAAAV